MKFTDIQKGKKYYTKRTEFKFGGSTLVENYLPVFVLETHKDQSVTASINGMPAQIYSGNSYCRWKREVPLDAGQSKLRKKFGRSSKY